MKKAIIIVIILLVLVVAGVFGWMCVASNIANTVYQRIEKYKFDVNNLESEKLFDFSTSRYFNQDKVSEGIIHKDSNQKISIISNLKVLGMYCEYDSQMNCGFSKSRTGHTDNVSKKQSYAIGDGVRLRDLSSWHVISDSSEYSDYITLIRDERLDINGDGVVITTGTVDNPDRIPFDKEGSNKYSVDSPSNVGYYLNVTYKDSLNYDDIVEIRLPYKEEIEALFNKTGNA